MANASDATIHCLLCMLIGETLSPNSSLYPKIRNHLLWKLTMSVCVLDILWRTVVCPIVVASARSPITYWSGCVSEWLTQALHLPRSRQATKIHDFAGISHDSHAQLFLSLPYKNPPRKWMWMPTCDVQPTDSAHLIQFGMEPFGRLTLADPDFGQPSNIDLLLGVEVFSSVVRQVWWCVWLPYSIRDRVGACWKGWFTCLSSLSLHSPHYYYRSWSVDWEIEEQTNELSNLSSEELFVTQYFKDNHFRDTSEGTWWISIKGHQVSPISRAIFKIEGSLILMLSQRSVFLRRSCGIGASRQIG